MIIHSGTKETTTFENLHDGTGSVHISKKVSNHDEIKGLDMFAEVTIDVDASIGYHIHKSEAEAYYILEGHGIFLDDGRVQKPVKHGDLCIITQGQGHGIINTGREQLKMIAIVWP